MGKRKGELVRALCLDRRNGVLDSISGGFTACCMRKAGHKGRHREVMYGNGYVEQLYKVKVTWKNKTS